MTSSCGECGITVRAVPSFEPHPPEFVHSSKIFAPAEIDESRSIIKRIHGALNGIDNEINHISRHLANLRKSRAQLFDVLATHHSVIAPIRKLHPEMLATIFSHCGLVHSLNLESSMTNYSNTARESIGLVCRQWRDVLVSTPYLWSCIIVQDRLGFSRILSWDIVAKRLDLELSRSGACPLTIRVDLDSKWGLGPENLKHGSKINELLRLHGPRWRRIRFPTLLPGFVFPHELPLLEYINTHVPDDTEAVQILSAPKLKSAQIRAESGYVSLSILPWTNLLHLNMSPARFGWHRIIQLCTSLRSLEISPTLPFWEVALGPNAIDTAANPVFVPALQSLEITYSNNHSIHAIWESLNLPSLGKLVLKRFWSNTDPGVWDISSFTQMLARSGCTITSLYLSVISNFATTVDFLRLLHTVTEFTLEVGAIPEDEGARSLFVALADERGLLPRLTNLSLFIERIEVQPVLDLVESRWNPPAYALRKAASTFGSPSRIRDADNLRRLLRLVESTQIPQLSTVQRLQTLTIKSTGWPESHKDLFQDLNFLQSEGLIVTWQPGDGFWDL